MKDNLKKLSIIAIIVFVIVFLFLSIGKYLDINIGGRNQRFLEVVLLIALTIVVVFLLSKMVRGYISMIKNKDKDTIKNLVFLIIGLILLMLILNLVVNKGKIIKRELIGGLFRLITFLIIIMGISYNEMNNHLKK